MNLLRSKILSAERPYNYRMPRRLWNQQTSCTSKPWPSWWMPRISSRRPSSLASAKDLFHLLLVLPLALGSAGQGPVGSHRQLRIHIWWTRAPDAVLDAALLATCRGDDGSRESFRRRSILSPVGLTDLNLPKSLGADLPKVVETIFLVGFGQPSSNMPSHHERVFGNGFH